MIVRTGDEKMLARKRFSTFLIVMITFAVLYMIYVIALWHEVENMLRLAVVLFLLLSLIFIIVISVIVIGKRKIASYIFLVFLKIGYFCLLVYIAFNVHLVYSALSRVSVDTILYSSSLVTAHSEATSIDSIGSGKIGVFNDENSIVGYVIPHEVIEKRNLNNEIVYMDSYFNILEAMEEGEVDYAFLPTDYVNMFDEIEALSEIINKSRIIYTEEKEVAITRDDRIFNLEEPMTFLLMGVDSYNDDVRRGSFNGDALMVVTFNPKTMRATMLSIPRDSYVPITCFTHERRNKITHAAWYGEECMAATIENFLDIEIDHVVKMNFRGLVKIVDIVGGIEVDVPYSFCEQDSQRRWGDHTVYVMEGKQTLDGEQALALTRNRKNNTSRCGYGVNWANDFVRGQNQQLVLKALMEEIKEVRDISTMQDIINELGNTVATNLQVTEILSFYSIFRDAVIARDVTSFEDIVLIQRLYLSGYDQYIHDYHPPSGHGTRGNLYNFIPYQGSLNDVINEMHINLGLEEREERKTFSFNVNEPYEEKIIGRGQYNETRRPLLPSFVGYSKTEIENYAKNNNLAYEFKIIEHQGEFQNGQFINQYPYPSTDLEYVSKLTIEIAGEYQKPSQPSIIDCSQEPGQAQCQFPNLVGKSFSEFSSIKAKYQLDWEVNMITIDNPNYNEELSGKVSEQNITPGTDIYELYDQKIVVYYMAEKETED